MSHKCAITGCDSKWNQSGDFKKIPMFPLPKNAEIQNKWYKNIDKDDINEKLSRGSLVCIKHFEHKFLNADKSLNDKAIPTLHLKTGSTLIDYEELLSQPIKKKRGTSGLMNLELARKKKLMRRQRMQTLAEKRRLAKKENSTNVKVSKNSPDTMMHCDKTNDYFLGDRVESDTEKVVISLRLTDLVKHLHDEKMSLCKHPSSIRDSKTYPIFNKIKNIQELLNNPVYWTKEQVFIFIEHITSQKAIIKHFDKNDIDGEAILSLTKSDLINFLKLDDSTSEILGTTFEQLRKETIMRYVNS
ncbi:unnamed protein product [Chironomus riparius]|uniref:THAP-type domain-containing protein n=1 Tax=Chironomus riparius TaxID=315576 RepID=A0A9N9RMY3_9DIPT|nr:unnamed protein product [Chironomus riparius]